MPQGVVHVQRNQKPLGDNGRIWELGTCVCADPGKGKEHRNWRKAYASLLPFSLFCLGLATALSIGLSQSTLLAMCAHHVCSDILSLETPFLPLSLVRGWGYSQTLTKQAWETCEPGSASQQTELERVSSISSLSFLIWETKQELSGKLFGRLNKLIPTEVQSTSTKGQQARTLS